MSFGAGALSRGLFRPQSGGGTPIPIVNPSFEDPALPLGGFQGDVPPGWSLRNGITSALGVIHLDPAVDPPGAYDGLNTLTLWNNAESVRQVVATAEIGKTYTMTVRAKQRAAAPGGTILVAIELDNVIQDFIDDVLPSATVWDLFTVSFTADAAGDVSVVLGSSISTGSDQQSLFDDVTLEVS